MKRYFRQLSKVALLMIYLVIIAGALVRMTGSGMGCPDWPKCFGYFIPPTEQNQLIFKSNQSYKKGMMILMDSEKFLVAKEDFVSDNFNDEQWDVFSVHDYVTYDPLHTWVEFLNRLIGALAGIPILILAVLSLWFFKENVWITTISLLMLCGMGFQAWLGKTVVDSNLAPYKISLHMMMALVIVFFILYLIFITKTSFITQVYNSYFYSILIVSLIITLIQIILGTQVRQYVDEQIKLIGYTKELWLSKPEINFYIHRSTSILVLLTNSYLYYTNKKLSLGFKKINFAMACIILEIITGILMYYFEFPILSQPLHLVIASVLFGIQIYILLELSHTKKLIQQKI